MQPQFNCCDVNSTQGFIHFALPVAVHCNNNWRLSIDFNLLSLKQNIYHNFYIFVQRKIFLILYILLKISYFKTMCFKNVEARHFYLEAEGVFIFFFLSFQTQIIWKKSVTVIHMALFCFCTEKNNSRSKRYRSQRSYLSWYFKIHRSYKQALFFWISFILLNPKSLN